ncbi:hypothetical protein IVB27_31365 [Bradyrhizobium sp. 197]|uniref:hypothetical protein n=1 Tax=Bradyrhizobium sp. 197 TaxID=2782663 RepID=UPI001FFA83A4|nr:hypothetical protein [Bradyrhizobium sp. 197]MCK1479117.1 hypothetical protein [Bradyrhizobium sp. 197]
MRQSVSDEINNYVYPYSGVEIGNPKSPEWIADQLRQMRSALVNPYWTTVGNDRCVIVADDGRNYCLAYSSKLDEYFLLLRKNGSLIDINVYGDAVGCFMAR